MRLCNRVLSVGIALVSLFVVAGCGGGGSHSSEPAYITRVNENTYTYSARVLALKDAQTSQEVYLSAPKTALYDADLRLIRNTHPEVKDIVALPRQAMNSVLVSVRRDAPWIKDWGNRRTTGEATLDAVIHRFTSDYALEEVDPLIDGGGEQRVFVLRFAHSLNTSKVAEQLLGTSPYLLDASPNPLVGDGNNIIRNADGADGSRNYTFSLKAGDCPAGCGSVRDWTFSVSRDGKTVTQIK